MKIACSTSAFRTSLDKALERVAGLGFRYVDLITIGGWDHVDADRLVSDWDREADRVEGLLNAAGMVPLALNVAVETLHDRTPAVCRARSRKLDAVVRLMKRLGVLVASFYPGYKTADRPWSAVCEDEAATLEEMMALGTTNGVTLALEFHFDTPFQTVEQCTRLIDRVPGLPVAFDPSHFAMQGPSMDQAAPLIDRAVHVHVRDAAPSKMQAACGQGSVNIPALIARLKHRDYNGVISVEYLPDAGFSVEENIVRVKETIETVWKAGQAALYK